MWAVSSELDDTSFFKRRVKNDVKGFFLLLTGFLVQHYISFRALDWWVPTSHLNTNHFPSFFEGPSPFPNVYNLLFVRTNM